jgi:predicted Zn finger-like uncharacterized protein
MFKVECPGCKASYNVDERRVPDNGLKMRCPKCSTTFLVRRPDAGPEADLPLVAGGSSAGADLPAPKASAPKAELPAVRADLPATKPLAPRPAAAKAAPAPPPKAPPKPATRQETTIGIGDEDMLPAVRPHTPPARQRMDSGAGTELDLPSPHGGGSRAAAAAPIEIDLPATRGIPPRPTVPRAGPPPAMPDELDLPSPQATGLPAPRAGVAPGKSGRQVTGGALFDDIDLPSPGGAVAAELPSPIGIDLPSPRMDLDLPSPRGGGVDLPAPRGAAAPDRGLDLPSPRGASADLPSPRGGGLDLPSPRGGGLDLPSPRGGGLDLPSPRGGGIDLPSPAGLDLPTARGAELPVVRGGGGGGGFGEIDLPTVSGPDLPARARAEDLLPAVAPAADFLPALTSAADFLPAAAKGAGLLPSPAAPSNRPAPADDPFDFGAPPPVAPGDFEAPLSFPPPPGGKAPSFSPPAAAAAPVIQRQSGGGTNFGEVDLGGGEDAGEASFGTVPPPRGPSQPPAGGNASLGWGERDLGGGSADDDMEFGAIPQEGGEAQPASTARQSTAGAAAQRVVAAPRSRPQQDAVAAPPPKRRALKITAGVLGAVILVGAGLGFTPFGFFGSYIVYDAYKAKDWASLLTATQKDVREAFTKDTADSAAQGLRVVDAAYSANDRARSVAAYGAFAGYLRELRFGHDGAVHARAKSMLASVPADATGAPAELARAAQTAAGDQLARGLSQAEAVLRRAPADVDALALVGEITLAAKDADRALAVWTTLSQTESSPRALFGLARAQLLKGQRTEAQATAKKVADLSASHAGSRLLLATLAWETSRDEATTTAYLDKVLKDPAVRAAASTPDLVAAHTLSGEMSLRRSRVSAAEASFNEALKLNPKASGALAGVGEALYRAGRHAEALARFGSAMEADPDAIGPKIGVAKTKIALERLQEAKDLLKGLSKSLKDQNKPSFQVISWLGRAEEALGDKASAEADYSDAIKVAGANGEVVDTYVWLAQLLLGQGRPAEAEARLTEAKAKLPKSVALHKALGDIAMQAGRYEEAEREYGSALTMDDGDVATRFKIGIVLRRLGKFEGSSAAFDKVAAADKDYPGLSLERAVLFEASGQSQKALDMYTAALAKAPDDPDLMLRVAGAMLASQQAQQAAKAEEILRKVLAQRQNSAEANHFMGRALLFRGTSYAEALKYLSRATDLDPSRAEYWLYVGWAANDADQQSRAQTALQKTLELDRSMADAYWQRGVLRRRQRAVIDAEADLNKALELRPSRYEAYATLAEVYEDQQKWPQALAAWQKAIAANGNRADWRYRVGKLMTQQGNRAGALEHLSKAMDIVTAADAAKPPWLAECSLYLADAERLAGKKELAVQHYQQFASLASADSPYLPDACKALTALQATSPACKR